MKAFSIFLTCLMFSACNAEYVSKKRDGLKPYYLDEESKQAQEEERNCKC